MMDKELSWREFHNGLIYPISSHSTGRAGLGSIYKLLFITNKYPPTTTVFWWASAGDRLNMKQRLINKHVTTTCEVMCDSWTRPMHASKPANILRTTCLKQETTMKASLPQVQIKIMVPPKDMHIMKISSLQNRRHQKSTNGKDPEPVPAPRIRGNRGEWILQS